MKPTIGAFRHAAAVAVLSFVSLALVSNLCAQSPLFPNTSPVYNNPYGAPANNPNGPFFRGVQFSLKPLPAAYSQPLPAPPPSVMAQFGGAPYNYGANSNVRVFPSTATFQPTRQPNWAPNFSSR